MREASIELVRLHKRLEAVDTVWRNLHDGLTSLITDWKEADLEQKHKFTAWKPNLLPELIAQDDAITLTLTFGQVVFRKNDPISHISARFTRDTSFGLDNILVLYKVEVDDGLPLSIVRVNDTDCATSVMEDILDTVRLNLLNPKVLPVRIQAAIREMNAATATH